MRPHDSLRGRVLASLLAVAAGCSRTGLEIDPVATVDPDASSPPPPPSEAGPPPPADAGPPSVLLFGGTDEKGAFLGDTWRWDRVEWTRLRPASAPPPRAQATLTGLGDSLVLVGGDVAPSDGGMFPVSADTWIWRGQAWSQASPSVSPDLRYGAAASAVGGSVVLFGGWGYPINHGASRTWTWDGVSWSAANGLASSFEPSAATLNGVAVAFGGENGDLSPTNVTSVWTGSTWRTLAPAHSPRPRRGASMAALGSNLVLFGGDIIGRETWESVNDTWIWDGADWTEATPSISPPARSNAAMATLSGVVVMFGGENFEVPPFYADTWEWDGSQWVERKVIGPGARFGAVMAGE